MTSQDFLFIVLGAGILVVSFFISLLLYYSVKVFREFYKLSKSFSKITGRVDEMTKIARDKVRQFTIIPLLHEAIKVAIEFLRDRLRKKERPASEETLKEKEKK